MVVMFAFLGIIAAHSLFVLLGVLIDARDAIQANNNLRAVLQDMEGGRL